MNIKPLRTPDDHIAALHAIETYWGAEPGTAESDALEILVDLVEHYEDRHFPITGATPVEIILAHMQATGRSQADLARLLGSAPRASEILNRKRALTVAMIGKLSADWGIPADCLVQPYALAAA